MKFTSKLYVHSTFKINEISKFNIMKNAQKILSLSFSVSLALFVTNSRSSLFIQERTKDLSSRFEIRIVISRAGEFSISRVKPEKYSGDILGAGCKVSFGGREVGRAGVEESWDKAGSRG